MGCNRINGGDVRPDNPSTANLPQIERSFAEIARLDPPPSLLFFTGDLVFGLNRDVVVLERQLRAWIELYRASPVGRMAGLRLVALPGNHESLRLAPGYREVSNPGAEAMWLSVMSPYIAGDNGPKAGGPDRLQTDQSRLTYSFRFRDTHFVVMNTDPCGAVATVPWTTDRLLNVLTRETETTRWRDPTGNVGVTELALHENWAGHRIADLEAATGGRLAFIIRLGVGLLPDAKTVIQAGDHVYMAAVAGHIAEALAIAALPPSEDIDSA